MVNYQFGKIYKIVCNITNKIYIGSTCEPTLARRLAKHVANYKQYIVNKQSYVSAFDIIKSGDYQIILIENFSCNSKDELLARERYFTGVLDCINIKRNQGMSLKLGKNEYSKFWYKQNIERITERKRKYAKEHKQQMAHYDKILYQRRKINARAKIISEMIYDGREIINMLDKKFGL